MGYNIFRMEKIAILNLIHQDLQKGAGFLRETTKNMTAAITYFSMFKTSEKLKLKAMRNSRHDQKTYLAFSKHLIIH